MYLCLILFQTWICRFYCFLYILLVLRQTEIPPFILKDLIYGPVIHETYTLQQITSTTLQKTSHY